MKRNRTPFVKRHHLSLGADYALRLIRIFTDLFDGDMDLAAQALIKQVAA